MFTILMKFWEKKRKEFKQVQASPFSSRKAVSTNSSQESSKFSGLSQNFTYEGIPVGWEDSVVGNFEFLHLSVLESLLFVEIRDVLRQVELRDDEVVEVVLHLGHVVGEVGHTERIFQNKIKLELRVLSIGWLIEPSNWEK